MKRLIIVSVLLATTILITNCTHKVASNISKNEMSPVEKVADVKKNFTSEQIEQGKTIYTQSCGRCHGLKDPSHFTVNAWENILPKMAPKAKLSDSATRLVRAYVLVNAEQG